MVDLFEGVKEEHGRLLLDIFIGFMQCKCSAKYCQISKSFVFCMMNNSITKEQLRILLFDADAGSTAKQYSRKFFSRYVGAGYYRVVDDDTTTPVYRITAAGRDVLIHSLRHVFKGNLPYYSTCLHESADKDGSGRNMFYSIEYMQETITHIYASMKRYKKARNKKHIAAIGNHLALLLRLLSPLLLKCYIEFPIYCMTDKRAAEAFILADIGNGFRTDMYYSLSPAPLEKRGVSTLIYCEMDTGSQNGNVILDKLKNYSNLFMNGSFTHFRSILTFSFLLTSYREITLGKEFMAFEKKIKTFGLTWVGMATEKGSVEEAIHQEDIYTIYSISLLCGVKSFSGLLNCISDLLSTNTGTVQIVSLLSLWREKATLMQRICKTDMISEYMSLYPSEADIVTGSREDLHPNFHIHKDSCDSVASKSNACIANMPFDAKALFKMYQTMSQLTLRRDLLKRETLKITDMHFLSNKGCSIYCFPSSYDKVFTPLLHPAHTHGFSNILDYLNTMKAGLLYMKGYETFFHYKNGLLTHNFTCEKADGRNCNIAIEHFSLDVLSSMRIEQFLYYFTSDSYMEPAEPLLLICFFLSNDLSLIRDLSIHYKLHLKYKDKRSMRILSTNSEVLFVCIEDYTIHFPGITFDYDGKGIYKLIITDGNLQLYQLDERAASVMDRTLAPS